MNKFTPAPWKIKKIKSFDKTLVYIQINDNNSKGIAFAGVYKRINKNNYKMEWDEEAEANARLIASAPEMLACLEDIKDFLQSHGYDTRLVKQIIKKANMK